MDEIRMSESECSGSGSLHKEDSISDRPCTLNSRICLIGSLQKEQKIVDAAQTFNIPVLLSDSGCECLNDESFDTVFVISDFGSEIFNTILTAGKRIIGPSVLVESASKCESLPRNCRPLYCQSMQGLNICFTGFRKREDLNRLIQLIHYMGGSIRKDMGAKVTHLIANSRGGEKYLYAATFRVPIMSEAWVTACWEQRNNVGVTATQPEFMCYRHKPFYGAHVCFLGFPEEEHLHMQEVLAQNGGVSVELNDTACTHVVVDESAVQNVPDKAPSKAHVVKVEWFWASVQNEACASEKEYLFEDYLEELQSPMGKVSGFNTPSSSSRACKRKRLCDVRLIHGESPSLNKRRSSVSDAALLSISGSFLDGSSTSLMHPGDGSGDEGEVSIDVPCQGASPRQLVFLELVQTEQNYVGILSTIMKLYKELEEKVEKGDTLLNHTEMKIIFGNLPPIYEVHRNMLEDLQEAALSWNEEFSIGEIILKYVPELAKAYPSFVNFFENTREMLVNCDQTKQRFHAFLKRHQTRPECGRQSLQELLIRPVQRLPSVILLLNDILKHTPKNNKDHAALEKALSAIREVMSDINEDKRRTEGQLVMFDIFNEIENCPPHLVSSHRSFVVRCDVVELSDGLSRRGDPLVFFLFSDTMEVCKKRSKAFKSPSVAGSLHAMKISKPYKHICLLPLSTIKKVIDIHETSDCHNAFSLRCRNNQEFNEKQYCFTLTDDETDKASFLRTLCRQIANTVCRTDVESFFTTADSNIIDTDTSDIVVGTLSKAFKRTKQKVGRAFSFNKTPSKLKRAVSTMMSPFGSTSNLTPASQLAQMRLASCNNLNELGTSPVNPNNTYIAPMSAQPTRKFKTNPLNVSSLRRL